nr:hypothetical protein GCM10020093_089020 [Planobispora longispora]
MSGAGAGSEGRRTRDGSRPGTEREPYETGRVDRQWANAWNSAARTCSRAGLAVPQSVAELGSLSCSPA